VLRDGAKLTSISQGLRAESIRISKPNNWKQLSACNDKLKTDQPWMLCRGKAYSIQCADRMGDRLVDCRLVVLPGLREKRPIAVLTLASTDIKVLTIISSIPLQNESVMI
jgi:hypothetical protein